MGLRAEIEAFVQEGRLPAEGAEANLGKKFTKRHEGDFFDWSHLVGAAYADAFCCDATTVEVLNGARELLGRAEPIALGELDKTELAEAVLELTV